MLPYKIHHGQVVIVAEVLAMGLSEGPELDGMAMRLQEELMRSNTKKMVMDCTRLKFMASSSLSVVVTLSRMAEQHKGLFAVCGLRNQLPQIFKLSGLDRFIRIYDTREQALAEMGE